MTTITLASLLLFSLTVKAAGGRTDSQTGSHPEGLVNVQADPSVDPQVTYWKHHAQTYRAHWLYALKKRDQWRQRSAYLLVRIHKLQRAGVDRRVHDSPAAAHHGVDACLSDLIERESHWNVHATNPRTGAYGLPQALPGSKMASAGADWRDNAATQIRWMRGYVQKYGGSCGALAFQKAHGWY